MSSRIQRTKSGGVPGCPRESTYVDLHAPACRALRAACGSLPSGTLAAWFPEEVSIFA
ncbi:MAG: hypothetical protein WCG52_11180 [bacterium]